MFRLLGQAFPEVDHISKVSDGSCFFVGFELFDAFNDFVKVVELFLHPTLIEPFVQGLDVDFRSDRHATANISGFRLSAAHAAKARGDVHHAAHVLGVEELARHIQKRESGAVDNALRTDVAEAACGHFSVHGGAECVVFFIVVLGGVVGNHQSIGDHHARGFVRRGEESYGVSRVEHQGLVGFHNG